jgi:hypothetical protein
MRIISGISNIITGVIIACLGFVGLEQYFIGNQNNLIKYEALYLKGESTMALLDTSSYDRINFKIKGIKVDFYETSYKFNVKESVFFGKYKFDNTDSLISDSILVQYLPNNPTVNCADIKKELKKAKKDINSNFDLWGGLVAILIAMLLILWGIRKFKQPLRHN